MTRYAKRTDDNHRDVVDDAKTLLRNASRVLAGNEVSELELAASGCLDYNQDLIARLFDRFRDYLPS